MSRQDKAVTERHAKTLRELLKRPENKLCADCKRNDPRWASWNLGVFLCIRCSGIHRSMGTHISKVKSVDLDVWTPEQMASIEKWGNRRANLYWEAHLRAGHIPPDHKMESYIRSKYESRRWARDGPPPQDPSILEEGAPSTPVATSAATPATPTSARPTHTPTASTGSVRINAPGVTNRQPQPHQLLSATVAARNAQAAAATPPKAPQPQQPQAPTPAQQQPAQSASNDLFSLDFHNPTPPAQSQAPKKDVKQDILSLFSSAAPAAAAQAQASYPGVAAGVNAFGGFASAAMPPQQNVWGAAQAPIQQAQPPVQQAQFQSTSMMGNTGAGMWGASSGWNAPPVSAASTNLWGAPTVTNTAPNNQFGGFAQAQPPAQPSTQNIFNTNDIWASSATTSTTAAGGGNAFGSSMGGGSQKQDDVFGDIWGGFK